MSPTQATGPVPVVRSTVSFAGGAGVTGVEGAGAGGRRGRNCRILFGANGRPLLALLLDADFLFERVPQLVGRPLELPDAPAKRTAELGQLARPEDDERDHQDDDQLGHSDGTKHKTCSSRSAAGGCACGTPGSGYPAGSRISRK